MIPTLYEKNAASFANNGIGFLTDIISCDVTEERNGAYECSFTYPVDGQHFVEIYEGRIIKVKPNETSDPQRFRIYSHSKPLNGVVAFKAEHISYDANGIPLVELKGTAITAQTAINRAINAGAFESNFTAWSDIATLNNINITEPRSLRAALGGQQGSVLDVWGGEFEFDNYAIKLHAHRGADNGVSIEYGKNLTDIKQERNITDTYTHILPYAIYSIDNEDGTSADVVVSLTEKVLPLPGAESLGHSKAFIINLSEMFAEGETVTESALRSKAQSYINSHLSLGAPKVNITVSFVPLWQTEEYKNIAPLERVQLCDTVTVRFAKLGISAKAKVIKTVYDAINEKYKSVELGDAHSNFADTVLKQSEAISDLAAVVRKGFSNATAEMTKAIADATAIITGNAGGYVVLYPEQYPQEILIMDTPDISTAVHVWRWNSSGLGYSSTGYNGTYGTAITMNGAIVADYITTGTLQGGLLAAGTVTTNALSAEYKASVTSEITGAVNTLEQSLIASDGTFRSTIRSEDIAPAISTALLDYYTKTETGSLISQSASSIMLQVYTKTETSSLISGAIGTAEGYTDTALLDYYTQAETSAAIELSSNSIKQIVSSSFNKYDESAAGHPINYRGFGGAAANGYPASGNTGKFYLDQNTGLMYVSDGSDWLGASTEPLPKITTELQTQITQNANDISLRVIKGDRTVSGSTVNDVISEINASSKGITLSTAGRLIITAGNFKLNASGTVTATNVNISGKFTTNAGSTGYYTLINDGVITTYHNNKRVGYIAPLGSTYEYLGIVGDTSNFQGLYFGTEASGTINTWYMINGGAAFNEEGCRHHFYGTAKFEDALYLYSDTRQYGNIFVSSELRFLNIERNVYQTGVWYDWGNGGMNVGRTAYKLWLNGSTIYADGTTIATTSDSRRKNTINDLDNRYLQFIKAIRPVGFKYNNGTSNRIHTGFIAQDVLQALDEAGIVTQDFAGFVDMNGDGSEYALRYDEFISPLLLYIKHLETRIEALERTG